MTVEARSPAPMLPLHVFRNRSFTGINLLTLIHYIALGSTFFLVTLNFQQAQNYTAFEAGLALLPIPILLFLMASPVGRLSDRVDSRLLIGAGVFLNCVGFWMYSLPGIDTHYWTSFFPAQVVFSVGLGLIIVPLTSVAIGALESRYSGVASGFNNAVSRVAQMLAVAIFGIVMLSGFRAGLAARTATLDLSADARAQLLSESSNLGATQPPDGLSAATAQAVQTAIRLAFVDGFRLVMWISIFIALVGLTLWLVIVRRTPQQVSQPQPAAASAPGLE